MNLKEGDRILIVGGGAAGCFASLCVKDLHPDQEVFLFERSAKLLQKVRISGGGRCNVTHGCFDPKILINNYPRGSQELLGGFSRFQPRDMIDWLAQRGVRVKQEADGRIFPSTDSSDTIIQCFFEEMDRLGVRRYVRTLATKIEKIGESFHIDDGKEKWTGKALILATGSDPTGWQYASMFGHTIVPPVPSLFALNGSHFPLSSFAGTTLPHVRIGAWNHVQEGALLLTHRGWSGPAALRLSAFGAREFAAAQYQTTLWIDWLPDHSLEEWTLRLFREAQQHPHRQLHNVRYGQLTHQLILYFLEREQLDPYLPLSRVRKDQILRLFRKLKYDEYEMEGKTTHREEFVTAGGVSRNEISWTRMASKRCSGLFFCGEILDVDGVTGGFNFQHAWTSGWIAGRSAAQYMIDQDS